WTDSQPDGQPKSAMEASSKLRSYAALVVQHRWLVLASVLGITLRLGLEATHIYVEVDPDRQLPQDHLYVRNFHEVHRLFGDWNLVVIGLKPTNGETFTPA